MGSFLRLSTAALFCFAAPAQAAGCRLALVLALDVSASVDETEDRLQREGLAQAILAPPVRRAFLAGGPVALHVFEWSMASHQVALPSGWQMISSEADLERVAAAVRDSRRDGTHLLNPPTAVGSALAYAAEAFRTVPHCEAKTIDISGDGKNNDGFAPAVAYAAPAFEDVTVNALVIAGANEGADAFWDDGQLVAWFEAEVLRGPGAFAVIADGYEDYARAMEMKLLRELEVPLMSGWHRSASAS